MTGAFESIRVLDLTHVLAGPFCAYQFALLGADVIKIEPPDCPDCARGRGPDPEANAQGLGLNYQVQGANKRALALDLCQPEGVEIFLKIAAKADVLIENFTTGSLDALGLGAEQLCAKYPRLIYCSITGYGDTGELAAIGAYDNVIQATSGTIAQSGGHKPGLSFVDYSTGYAAAFAVAAALHQREQSGSGASISVSMLETAMSLMAPEAAAEKRPGSALPKTSEAGICAYQTSDGILMPGAFTPAQYRKLADCLNEIGSDLPEAREIDDWPDVWANADRLKAQLKLIFATRSADDWVKILHATDIPAERVATLAEAVTNPQLDARAYFSPHSGDAGVTLPLGPSRYSTGGPAVTRPPPRHGEHSDEILTELGLTPARVKAMRSKGIVR